MEITVRPALKSDIPEIGRILGIAFADDPVMSWILPERASRQHRASIFFNTVNRHHFLQHGGVDIALDDNGSMAGAAVWAPPGHWQTSGLTNLRALPGMVRAFGSRLITESAMSRQMETAHPREPHWYLAFIGTSPAARGSGYGQALLDSRLRRCDAEGAPAYLETGAPDNVPYYERFGFAKTGELRIANNGPLMWPMWRAPQQGN